MEENQEAIEYEEEEEEEEDEDEEEDDDDYDYEVEEMKLPRVSSWIAADGTTLHGVVVINDGRNKRGEIDVCPICFDAWTVDDHHRICCLPCGHIYGLSCINKWLHRAQSSGRCPKCNILCTLNDVKLLYTTRFCVTDHKALTRRFPFTNQGLREFNQYISRKLTDVLELKHDASKQHADANAQWRDAFKRTTYAIRQRDVLEQMANALRPLSEALELLFDALKQRYVKLEQRSDALERKADALGRWVVALGRLADACIASKELFHQRYKAHCAQILKQF